MEILELYHTNGSVEESCTKKGIGRSSFYQRRHIAEMMETDRATFDELAQDQKNLKELNKRCKEKLSSSPQKQNLSDLKKAGKLLP